MTNLNCLRELIELNITPILPAEDGLLLASSISLKHSLYSFSDSFSSESLNAYEIIIAHTLNQQVLLFLMIFFGISIPFGKIDLNIFVIKLDVASNNNFILSFILLHL